MSTRERDLDNGRKKLEEFRARKAARASSIKSPPPRATAALGENSAGASFAEQLEAKLASMRENSNIADVDDHGDASSDVDDVTRSPESSRMRPQIIDEDYSTPTVAAARAAARNLETIARAALRQAEDDFENVDRTIGAMDESDVALQGDGESARELETLKTAFAEEREALKGEIEELRARTRELEAESERARVLDGEVARLHAMMEAKEVDAGDAARAVETMRAEIAEKVEALRSASEDVQRARAEVEAFKLAAEEAKTTSKEKVKKAIAKGKSIEAEKKVLELEIETLRLSTESHATLSEGLGRAEARVKSLEVELAQAKVKADALAKAEEELSSLKTSHESLQSQLGELDAVRAAQTFAGQEVLAAQAMIEKLRGELESATAELTAKMTEIEIVREEAKERKKQIEEDLTSTINVLKALEAELSEERSRSKEERANHMVQVEDITNRLDATERAVFEKDAEVESLVARIDEAKTLFGEELVQLRAAVEAAQSEKASEEKRTASHIESLKDALVSAKLELEELVQANDALKCEFMAKDEEIAKLKMRIEEVTMLSSDEVDALLLQLSSAKAEKKASDEKAAEFAADLRASNDAIEALRAIKSNIEHALEMKDEEIATLSLEMRSARDSSLEDLKNAQSKLDAIEIEKNAQRDQLVELTVRVQERDSAISSLSTEMASNKEVLRARDEEIASLIARIESSNTSSVEIAQFESRIEALEREKIVMDAERAELSLRTEQAENEVAALAESVSALHQKLSSKDEDIAQLRAEMVNAQGAAGEEISLLREALAGAEEERRAKVAYLTDELAAASDLADVARKEIDSLITAKAAVEASLVATSDKFLALMAEADATTSSASDELALLQNKLDAVEEEKHAQETQLKEYFERLRSFEEAYALVNAEKSALSDSIEAKNEELARLRDRVGSLESESSDQVKYMLTELSALREAQTAAAAELDSIKVARDASEARLLTLESERSAAASAAAAQAADAAELADRLEREIEILRAREEKTLSDALGAADEKSALIAARDSAEASREVLLERLAALEIERDELASASAAQASAASALAVELEAEIAALRVRENNSLTAMSDVADERNALIAALTAELENVKVNGAMDAQRRVGELEAALDAVRSEAVSLRRALDEASQSLTSLADVKARASLAEANLASAHEVQKDLAAKLAESSAALRVAPPTPPSSAARRVPRTPSEHGANSMSIIDVDVEAGDRDHGESPSKTMRMWRDSRVVGKAPKIAQPIMDVCDRAFVRFFRVMRTNPGLRFAAMCYWAIIHAWLFLRFVVL